MGIELPLEVQLFILQSLSHQDLTQVALVNRSWNAAAISLIWKSIRLLSISQANTFLNGRETHGRHLRHIETFQTRLLLAATTTLLNDSTSYLTPRLSTLDIMVPTHRMHLRGLDRWSHLNDMKELRRERISAHGPIPPGNGQNSDDESIEHKAILIGDQEHLLLEILRRNPQLETFKMAMLPDNPQEFLIQLSPLLPRLKHLELFRLGRQDRPSMDIAVIDAFLKNMSTQIQSVTLDRIELKRYPTEKALTELLQPLMESGRNKKHPALKLLRINDNMDNERAKVLVPFLQGCKNLRMIETKREPTPRWEDDMDWVNATPIFRTILEELTGRRVGAFRAIRFWEEAFEEVMQTDEWIADRISSFREQGDTTGYWHTINLTNSSASKLTAKAIVDCCHDGLRSLNLARCQGIESEDIQEILSKAVGLRHLACNAPSESGYKPDPVVLASHILQSTWVSTWLVRLNIHIGGIPRPDIKVNEGGRPVKVGEPLDNCTVEESHALQHKIYKQIGQLTLLEELSLGFARSRTLNEDAGYETDKVQRNCLEMTLESGLYLLGGLKSLRALEVVNMAHRIEAPELDWMQSSWPEFHSILGILFRPYPEDKTRSGTKSTWRKMMRGRGLAFA
ncbi:hypothetical protein EC991_003435 [Linnemannia zychae]|nr:hypothetical protein EC991_003435 [Linnemannia zychae]